MTDFIDVPMAVNPDGEHLWGLPGRHVRLGGVVEEKSDGKTPGVSTSWLCDPPISRKKDIDRITALRYRFDTAETQRSLQRIGELTGDMLPVRPTSGTGDHLLGLKGSIAARLGDGSQRDRAVPDRYDRPSTWSTA
jgi:hypothetical protein